MPDDIDKAARDLAFACRVASTEELAAHTLASFIRNHAALVREQLEKRPEHPPQRERVPREPDNKPGAITRKDERGATWTLKWQALYEGGIGEERNATAESLMLAGFQPDRRTVDLTGEAMRDCIEYLHKNDGFRSLRVRVFDGEIKLEILTAAKGLEPIAESRGALFHDAVATLKDDW